MEFSINYVQSLYVILYPHIPNRHFEFDVLKYLFDLGKYISIVTPSNDSKILDYSFGYLEFSLCSTLS